MKHALKQLIKRAGYEIHRSKVPFVPFIRHFALPSCDFDFWIANEDASWWYGEDAWRRAGEFKEIGRLVKSGDRVLEIGAHHGLTGLICAHFVGAGGSVLSVEAHPWNAMVDAAQLGLNPSIRNLRFINAAGSDQEGKLRMVVENHNSSVGTGDGAATVEVPARTGDALDKEFGPFNVLKIDVEGFETKVLKGCQAILKRRPKLIIEVHLDELPKYGTSAAEVFELINVKDYAATMILRPETETIKPFDPGKIPSSGIVNVFLTPR